MGFKNNKTKYYVVKVGFLDKKCKDINDVERFELTREQVRGMIDGLIPMELGTVLSKGLIKD